MKTMEITEDKLREGMIVVGRRVVEDMLYLTARVSSETRYEGRWEIFEPQTIFKQLLFSGKYGWCLSKLGYYVTYQGLNHYDLFRIVVPEPTFANPTLAKAFQEYLKTNLGG